VTPEQFARAQELFEQAMGLPPAERKAFVDRESSADQVLRGEVLRLIASDEVSVRTGDLARGMAIPEATKKGELGSVRGYRLLEILGKGGFGIVYRAQRREDYRQEVALKVIKPGKDSDEVIARFEQERQALAVMDHPNIAKILDGGLTDKDSPMGAGRPFFVMELVQGQAITDYCDARRLSVAARLELFIQVCDAVQHAHLKRVIHRDLKPQNILVADKEGVPAAKVIDFGVAKAIDKALTDRTFFTETGQLIGTPEYMSPEQAGSRPDIDTRTDVYGLGVVLYELLVGAPPFDPKDLRSRAEHEMMRVIREVDPPSAGKRLSSLLDEPPAGNAETPSVSNQAAEKAEHRRVRAMPTAVEVSLRRGVSADELARLLRSDLEWIPQKAMEKDRERRYETARDLGEDVRRYLRQEAVLARPASVGYRARKWVRRHRAATAAALVVLVGLTAGVTALALGLIAERRAKDRSEQAAAVSGFVLDTLLQAPGPGSGGPDIKVADVLLRAEGRIETDFAEKPLVRLALHRAYGDVFSVLSRFDDAARHADAALILATRYTPDDLGLLSELYESSLKAFEQLGRYEKAGDIQARWLDVIKRGGSDLADHRITFLHRSAVHSHDVGDYDGAEWQYRQSLKFADAAPGKQMAAADVAENLARLLIDEGLVAASLPLIDRALSTKKALAQESPHEIGYTFLAFGYHQLASGDNGGALKSYREALRLYSEAYKSDKTQFVMPMLVRTIIQGLFEDCPDLMAEALPGEASNANSPDMADLGAMKRIAVIELRNRARLQYRRGNLRAGDKLFERSLAVDDVVGGDARALSRAHTLRVWGELLAGTDAGGAETKLREALQLELAAGPDGEAPAAETRLGLARLLVLQPGNAEAQSLALEAVKVRQRLFPEAPPLAAALLVAADCYGKLGSSKEAADARGRAERILKERGSVGEVKVDGK